MAKCGSDVERVRLLDPVFSQAVVRLMPVAGVTRINLCFSAISGPDDR